MHRGSISPLSSIEKSLKPELSLPMYLLGSGRRLRMDLIMDRYGVRQACFMVNMFMQEILFTKEMASKLQLRNNSRLNLKAILSLNSTTVVLNFSPSQNCPPQKL